MDEGKYDKLLNAAIVLLIVSATVLCFSVYKTYFADKPTVVQKKNVLPKVISTRDSLQKVYTNTVQNIDSAVTSAAPTDTALQAKYAEMDVLKTEIATLLKGQDENDLASAKLKIEELQLKVALLQNRYTNVESENKRLQVLINQLMAANKMGQGKELIPAAMLEKAKATLQERNINKGSNATYAMATDIRLFAVAENNDREIETSSADDAEKIVGSFVFKNNEKANAEVMVIVMQPDGKVLKNSVWESGTFDTKEGKKIYSRKILVESQGEEKRLNFSLSPDSIIKGNYIMQVWYNGNLIARAVKVMA
jgi:hypothetical protein